MLPPRSALRPERGRVPVVCVRTAAVDAPSSRSVALPGARSRTRLVRRRARRSAHAPRHACSLPMAWRVAPWLGTWIGRDRCGPSAARLPITRRALESRLRRPTTVRATATGRSVVSPCSTRIRCNGRNRGSETPGSSSTAMRPCAHDHKSNAMKVDAAPARTTLRSISSSVVRSRIDRPSNGAILQHVPAPRGCTAKFLTLY